MADELIPGTTTQNGLVAQSDLMYEAPDNTPDFDLGALEKNFIDQYSGLEADDVPDEPTDDAAAETPAAPEVPADDDEEDPKLARGIQRVVAREMAAKEREMAAEKRIAELKSMEEKFSKYGNVHSIDALAQQMDLDPIGAFKALGKDPDTMIKLALATHLGDKAPESLKEFAAKSAGERRIRELEQRLEAKEQAQRASEYFNTIQTGAREYVLKGDSNPTLSLVAKADPDYARDEIMEEIVSEAKRQAATNPNGEPISYEEAAKRVETRFARLAKLLSVQNGTNPATKNVKKPNVTPPSTKSSPKPLAPWQRNADSIEEQGLAEAMRVLAQEEAARKRR